MNRNVSRLDMEIGERFSKFFSSLAQVSFLSEAEVSCELDSHVMSLREAFSLGDKLEEVRW